MPMEVITVIYKLTFKERIRKVALRRRPYITENESNESDVIKYLKPEEVTSIRRIDDKEYYGWTDDKYYKVLVDDALSGFVNKLAFEEDSNGS